MTQQYRAPTPWRTRGTINPGLGVPTAANISVLPQDPILVNDAFVITDATQGSAMSGLMGTVGAGGAMPGDLLVANGGGLGSFGGWTYVPQPLPMDGDQSYVLIAGQRNPVVE